MTPDAAAAVMEWLFGVAISVGFGIFVSYLLNL